MSNKFYLNFLNKYNLRPFQEYLVSGRTSIPKIVKGEILNQRKRERDSLIVVSDFSFVPSGDQDVRIRVYSAS